MWQEAGRLIDLGILAANFSGNTEKVRKFAYRFLENAWGNVHDLELALREGNLASLAAVGHRGKSSARAVGAAAFADLCQSLEHINGPDALGRAREMVSRLRPMLEQIERQIDAELASESPWLLQGANR